MSSMDNIAELMTRMGKAAAAAASSLANVSPRVKDQALTGAAAAIRSRRGEILEANDRDMTAARAAELGAPLLDRLRLDPKRVEAIARSMEEIVALPDPIGTIAAEWDRPSGLHI